MSNKKVKSARKKKRYTKDDFLVDQCAHALGKRLKRNLIWEEPKGRSVGAYHIYDPAFLSLQRDSKAKDVGRFTSGFYIKLAGSAVHVGFRTEHIRSQIQNLVLNSQDGKIVWECIKNVSKGGCYLDWSSKAFAASKDYKLHAVGKKLDSLNDLKAYLKKIGVEPNPLGLANDIGVDKMRNTYGKSKNYGKRVAGSRGSLFWLQVEIQNYDYRKIIRTLKKFETLFLSLYPTSVTRFRGTSFRPQLKRFYESSKIPFECAFIGCKKRGYEILEAAHLKSTSAGGSDHLDNLVFLCHNHHRNHQEGRPLAEQKRMLKKRYLRHTKLG